MNQNLIPLLMLGIPASGLVLRAILFLIYGARGPAGGQARIYSYGRGLGAFIFIGSLAFFLLPAAFFLGGALLLFGGYALIEWLQARRDLQRQAIWSVLVNTQQNNRSLKETLSMHSPRFTGIVGRSYNRLQQALNEGSSIPAAINNNRNCIPETALATVSLFEGESLPSDPRLAGIMPIRMTSLWSRIYFFFSYLLFAFVFGLSVLTFLMIAIIPAFEAIFIDFGLEIPTLTQSLFSSASYFASTGLGTIFVLLAFSFHLFLFIAFIYYLFDKPLLKPLFDRIGWFKHQSQILYLLAESISRKQSFADTITRLTSSQPGYGNKFAVKRLEKAGRMAAVGYNWIDSLYQAKIIRKRDIGPLETASKAGNITWVLRRISDDILERAILRLGIIEKTILPIVVVLFGMVVAWVVVGLFVPLVSLIQNLT